MKYHIPLWLGWLPVVAGGSLPRLFRFRFSVLRLYCWLPILAAVAVAAGPTQPAAINVFADLRHTGTLSGPLPASPTDANEFGIAVPLPASYADRDPLPARIGGGEDFGERLGRLRIETKPGAPGPLISISCENDGCLRLFQKVDRVWRRVAPNEGQSWTLTPDQKGTLELGVGVVLPVAKAGAHDPIWPRTFAVEIGPAAPGGDRIRVPFRVAPFLIPSTLDPVEELLIVSQPATADSVDAIQAFAEGAGVKLYLLETFKRCDQWMQDAIEPALFPFPTFDRTRQARAALTGIRRPSRRAPAALDQLIAERLRARDVVNVIPGVPRKQSRWIDWFGNLEVTPPYSDRQGRRFPYGRVITGKQNGLSMHPGVMKFLEAQAMQWPPIVVDVSWLAIGHVDEVVTFVPAKTDPGFKVLLPSPAVAREMLDALLREGLDDAVVFAETDDETTVDELRETIAFSDENLAIDDKIAQIRDQLKREMNLENADFVMVPAFFQWGRAVIPNAVNSVVVNRHLLVPAPHGPELGGRDYFEEAIRRALASCDVRVVFIDTWNAYHSAGGEIHCGTNTFRRLRDPVWWKHVVNAGDEGK
jgi:Protein-arginine deiminase (PAD)